MDCLLCSGVSDGEKNVRDVEREGHRNNKHGCAEPTIFGVMTFAHVKWTPTFFHHSSLD